MLLFLFQDKLQTTYSAAYNKDMDYGMEEALQRQEDKVLETKSLEVWRQRPPSKEEDGADAAKSKKAWRELLMTTRLKQSISVKKQPRPSEYSEAFADAAVEVESFPTKTKTRTKERHGNWLILQSERRRQR